MTAIARIYTPDGFAVAADGHKLDARTHAVGSDEVQKLFHLRHMHGEIIGSIAGTGEYPTKRGKFDFGTEIIKAARSISSVPVINADDYASRLGNGLLASMKKLGPSAVPLNESTTIYLDGYVLGNGMRRQVTLRYSPSGVSGGISADSLAQGRMLGRGSQAVSDILFSAGNTEARLPQYRHGHFIKAGDLSSALLECRNFVAAHCDPEALEIDRWNCEAIGGHIHVAALTRESGFKWDTAPKNLISPL